MRVIIQVRGDDMPRKALVPCGHFGCPELVDPKERYCAQHKVIHKSEERPSASDRGYNRRWQKASKLFLQAHPLCVRCAAEGRYVKSEVVDHITPHRGDKALFWDMDNWQALCKRCHDLKTLTEDINPVYHY